jgi:hypothetical protein
VAGLRASGPSRVRRLSDSTRLRACTRGETVEIGCIGGRGRTGTVLACLAVLAGVNPPEAVAWVRSNYRSDAVENVEQEAWVDWFADYVRRADASDPSLGPVIPRR